MFRGLFQGMWTLADAPGAKRQIPWLSLLSFSKSHLYYSDMLLMAVTTSHRKTWVGRSKMKGRSFFSATAFLSGVFCATAVDAQLGKPTASRPVTENDIAGRKICWDDGGFTMFEPDGQFTNNRGGHTQWSVTQPGVVKIGVTYRQYEILPDGSFYMHRFLDGVGSITGHIEHWGKVCN